MQNRNRVLHFLQKSGQVFHKDDYLADDGVHQVRKAIELTGDEEIGLSGYERNNQYFIVLPDIKVANSNDETNEISFSLLSNYFKSISSNDGYNKNNIDGISVMQPYPQVRISLDINRTTIIRNNTAFKNKLKELYEAGTPLIIEYPLAKEIIEPYSEAQQKAYEQIENAKSYKGTTHIFSEDEIKPILEVEAFADISTSINTKEKVTEEIKEESEEKI